LVAISGIADVVTATTDFLAPDFFRGPASRGPRTLQQASQYLGDDRIDERIETRLLSFPLTTSVL
jgi:hypothetical protein